MSKVATLTLSVAVTGDGVNEQSYPVTVQVNPSPADRGQLVITSAGQTLIPPVNPQTPPSFLLLIPPSTSAVTKTLKGVTGDTGFQISQTNPTLIAVNSSTVLFIAASGTEVLGYYWL